MTITEFCAIVDRVTQRAVDQGYPEARKIKHVVGVCDLADEDHEKTPRQYAHAFHLPSTVCWAGATLTDLSDENILGIAAHELGHLLRGKKKQLADEEQDEMEVDVWILDHLGIEIAYDANDIQYMRAYHDQGFLPNMEDE